MKQSRTIKLTALLLCLLVNIICAKNKDKIIIKKTIGTYPLYFDKVYSININNAYGTLIKPPEGYRLMDVALGDSKLYSNELVNNRARIKKIAPDNPKSNAHLIIKGPDGVTRSVTIELTGERKPRISTVKFIIPTNRELNVQLEQMKSQYLSQMNEKLYLQERQLNKSVQEKTMMDVQLFRFNSYPSSTSKKELGAVVSINNIANSAGKGYVYLSTNAEDPECRVIQLKSITGKNLSKQVRLIDSRVDRGTTYYVYETSPFTKKTKKQTLKFNIKIYQKPVIIKAYIL